MKVFLFLLFLHACISTYSQTYVVKDIKSFGAKGNGKTNDHDAFTKAAAFFNKRGGNGKLIISSGTFIVGKQKFNKDTKAKPVYEGEYLLDFSGVQNFSIEGSPSSIIKYKPGLHFGTFLPSTGRVSQNSRDFYDISHAATIGDAISISGSSNVFITNLELDGNSNAIVLGGIYGDVGRQLPHSGIVINNSTNVTIHLIKSHHFGLDGITVRNNTGGSKTKDSITISNSSFEYNGRQGLSWVGGNDLTVVNCKFNHTGKGKIASPPGAGVDIEAEVGTISGGKFFNCEFINNVGCGLVADSGPSSDCRFVNCTFWGVTDWSVWVAKPRFSFDSCKIYGSIVHGFNADNDKDATRFLNCVFEDKAYNGKEPHGEFLIEENYARRMRFENCLMKANKKKIVWFGWSADWQAEEKYQLVNCKLEYAGNNHPDNDWIAIFRNVRFTNTSFTISNPLAEKKKYYLNGIGEKSNVFKNGNTLNIGKKISTL